MIEKQVYEKKVTNAEVAAETEARIFTPSESDEVKFAPFNQCLVSNNSTEDIFVRPNGDADRQFPVFAGNVIAENTGAFNYLTIYNNDASNAIAAGEIIINVKKVV